MKGEGVTRTPTQVMYGEGTQKIPRCLRTIGWLGTRGEEKGSSRRTRDDGREVRTRTQGRHSWT